MARNKEGQRLAFRLSLVNVSLFPISSDGPFTMNTDRNFQVSVALVTRNRPESLARCLRSWRMQNVQPFEIVVSDDSEDRLQEQNRQVAREFEARWIAGPRRGLYANRNHIAKACLGSHIR